MARLTPLDRARKSSLSNGVDDVKIYNYALTPLDIMFYTYVLLSLKDKKWYTGFSDDLKRRFEEHNKGLVYATRRRRPFNLIYYESCLNENDAKMRENYLKTGMGKRYIKNRLKFFFNEKDV